MDQKYIVALELSGTRVKGVLASVSGHADGTPGVPAILSIVAEDSGDCVQYGRVQNLINAGKLTKQVLTSLQGSPELEGASINGAYVALAGRSLGSEQVSVEVELPNEMVITNEIMADLYRKASKMVSVNKFVAFVKPRRFVVDSQVMPSPVGALASKLRGDFTLVTCNPINRRNLDMVFQSPDLGIVPPKEYIVTPLAVADLVLSEEDKQLGCVLIDLGSQTTTISVYKDRALQYLATLPLGSNNITRDISVEMNVTPEKAEAAKCRQGDAQPRGNHASDDITRMNQVVAARANEIVANIINCINYTKYKPSDLPEGIVLTGRGSRLKNFDNLLASQSKMRVRHASVPQALNLAMPDMSINPDDYLSLLSMVARISHNPAFESCVTQLYSEPQPQPQAAPRPAVKAETEVLIQPQTSTRASKVVDEDNWDKDDDDEPVAVEKVKKEKANDERPKNRRSWLEKLKSQAIRIMSDDGLGNDAEIE